MVTMRRIAMHPDDVAEEYELDKQLNGGYAVFEWRDIAKDLISRGHPALATRIRDAICGKNEVDHVQVPVNTTDRNIILYVAAQLGI